MSAAVTIGKIATGEIEDITTEDGKNAPRNRAPLRDAALGAIAAIWPAAAADPPVGHLARAKRTAPTWGAS